MRTQKDLRVLSMSRVMRKSTFCICESKGADQVRGYCFWFAKLMELSLFFLVPKLSSEISSLFPSSVAVQTALCRIWLETSNTCCLATRLIYIQVWYIFFFCFHLIANAGARMNAFRFIAF